MQPLLQINQGTTQVATTSSLLGIDVERRKIGAELAAVKERIAAAPANDLRVQSIAAWHTSFTSSLRHPNLQQVITSYVEELVKLLRAPPGADGVEPPFPAELFGNKPLPLIRHLVEQLRDPRSLFYSEQFDQEAARVLSSAPEVGDDSDSDIPEEILAQLHEIQANIAVENQGIDRLHALQGRVSQRESALQENIQSVAQQHLQMCGLLRQEAERIGRLDLEERAAMVSTAERLKQEAVNLRAQVVDLQHQLSNNRHRIDEVDAANAQLQIEIKNTRAAINDNKSNWILDVACIVGSVALSWTFQMPIVIMPPKK